MLTEKKISWFKSVFIRVCSPLNDFCTKRDVQKMNRARCGVTVQLGHLCDCQGVCNFASVNSLASA